MPVKRTEELTIANSTENLPKVREFMTTVIESCQVVEQYRNKIILAVDEAVSNIIEHAYSETDDDAAEIYMKVESLEDCIRITIVDSGIEFDPNGIGVPDIQAHIKEGRKNGLGVFLMRQIMDEVSYRFKSGLKNELVMVKYFRE